MATRRTRGETLFVEPEDEAPNGDPPGDDEEAEPSDPDEADSDDDEDEDVPDDEDEDEDVDEEEDEDEEPERQPQSKRQNGRTAAPPAPRSIEAIQAAVQRDGIIYPGELSRLRAHNQSVQARLANARAKRDQATTKFQGARTGILTDVETALTQANLRLPEGTKQLISQLVEARFNGLLDAAEGAATAELVDQLESVYTAKGGSNVAEFSRLPLHEKMNEVADLLVKADRRTRTATARGQQNRTRIKAPPRAGNTQSDQRGKSWAQLETGYGEGTLSAAEEKRYLAQLARR